MLGGQIFSAVAEYKGQLVAVKKSPKRKIIIDRSFLLQMRSVSRFPQQCLTFYFLRSYNQKNMSQPYTCTDFLSHIYALYNMLIDTVCLL